MGNFCNSETIQPPSCPSRKPLCKDDFEVLQLLGHGSFGKVVLVRKKNNGRLFALKVINKNKLELSGSKAQAVTERDILTSVDS